MNFKKWLNIEEEATATGAVASGSTTTADIARVPTSLFGTKLVKRNFPKLDTKNGLAGKVEPMKFNKK